MPAARLPDIPAVTATYSTSLKASVMFAQREPRLSVPALDRKNSTDRAGRSWNQVALAIVAPRGVTRGATTIDPNRGAKRGFSFAARRKKAPVRGL